jgi:hypothetical protein
MNEEEKEELRETIKEAIDDVFDGVTVPAECSAWLRLSHSFDGAPDDPNPLTIDIYDDNSEVEKPFCSVTVADALEKMFVLQSDRTGQLIPDVSDYQSFRLVRDELRRLADCIDRAMEPRDVVP